MLLFLTQNKHSQQCLRPGTGEKTYAMITHAFDASNIAQPSQFVQLVSPLRDGEMSKWQNWPKGYSSKFLVGRSVRLGSPNLDPISDHYVIFQYPFSDLGPVSRKSR